MAKLQDIFKEIHIFYPLYKHAYKRLQKYECKHRQVAPSINAHLHFLKDKILGNTISLKVLK